MRTPRSSAENERPAVQPCIAAQFSFCSSAASRWGRAARSLPLPLRRKRSPSRFSASRAFARTCRSAFSLRVGCPSTATTTRSSSCRPYKRYTRRTPPPCATSSNMERTDYGYPAPDGAVRLTLTPTVSATHHWCRGGSYIGAIYAVPHAPPCESKYPCRSEPYEPRVPAGKSTDARYAGWWLCHGNTNTPTAYPSRWRPARGSSGASAVAFR